MSISSSAQTHRYAGLAVFGGGLIVGLTSLFARMAQSSDAYELQFMRTWPFALMLIAVLALSRNHRLIALPKRRDWLLGTLLIGCFYGFMFGVTNTSIPRAIFALTTYPLWAALLGWWALGERPNRVVIIALGLALAGLVVMTSSGLFGSPVTGRDLIGMGCALVGGFACGGMLVSLRLPADRWPGVPARGYLVGCIMIMAIALAVGGIPQPSAYDVGIGIAHGVLALGLSFFLIAWGAARIPSARAGLFLAVEVLSGPALVWVFLGEGEELIVYLGGFLVLAAIVLQALKGGSRA